MMIYYLTDRAMGATIQLRHMVLRDKIAIALDYGYKAEDAFMLYEKYRAHKGMATYRGLSSELSFEEYLSKAIQAGVNGPEEIGTKAGQFVLGRIGDVGPYTRDSCRFITTEQNSQEGWMNGRHKAGVLVQSSKMTGRTKENHPGRAAQAEKLAKEFVLIDPSGLEHRGRNVSDFCSSSGLYAVAIYEVLGGKRSEYKGWTGYYV